MTVGVQVQIDLSDWARADRTINLTAEDALMAVALDGEAYAKRKMTPGRSAPGEFPGVDTGNLRAGLHAADTNEPLRKQLISSAAYSLYLEYGTEGRLHKGKRVGAMAARPFMRPTARYMQRKAPETMARLFNARLG
jgi:hypothetical protein